MPSKIVSTPVEKAPGEVNTKWNVFEDAKLIPTQIICDTIPMHPADEACHTRLELKASIMVKHTVGNLHGGGFRMTFRQSSDKKWPGWKQLKDAGMELVGLRCEVCDKQIDLSVRDFNNHMRAHQGKFRGAAQNYKDMFFLQIQNGRVVAPEEEDGSVYIESSSAE